MTIGECNSAVRWCRFNDPIVTDLRHKLNKRRCTTPVSCINCQTNPIEPAPGSPRGPQGFYGCGRKRIFICAEMHVDDLSICRTYAHELIHALDHCNGAICQTPGARRFIPVLVPHPVFPFVPIIVPTTVPSGCDQRACSEIRAYAESGNCCHRNPHRDPGTIQDCIRLGVTKSLAGCGGPATIDGLITKWWTICFDQEAANRACREIAPLYPPINGVVGNVQTCDHSGDSR